VHSLRVRLSGLWLLCLAAAAVVALLLLQLRQQSASAQLARAGAEVASACDLIRDRYGFFTAGWAGAPGDLRSPAIRARLADVVGLALRGETGIEGGIWDARLGPLAYAYPTHEGGGPKTDLPRAERPLIAAVNREAARDDQPLGRRERSRSQTLLLYACPLPGTGALTAWTMTRVSDEAGLRLLLLGLAALFGLLAVMALWLGRILWIWRRHVQAIEAALAQAGGDAGENGGVMPAVPQTGEREFDRIIDALNQAGSRLAASRRQGEALAGRAARAEHLAGLGRVAAGVAHEIRNPIAAARLQGENGLAGDDARRVEAIGDMLVQLDRLDLLAGELLAMTQRATPRPVAVRLDAFAAQCLERHRPVAGSRAVALRAGPVAGEACFDPAMVGRILDNLLANAIRHSPPGGEVRLLAERPAPGRLAWVVEDEGGGVSPELGARLFEPFVTGRADGTGLGLAIARELADAHGGRLDLRTPDGPATSAPAADTQGVDTTRQAGATFVLELPAPELPAPELPASELPCPPC